MLLYGFLITLIGMGFVFLFLYFLMLSVQVMSKFTIQKKSQQNDAKVAAMIAIALRQGGGNG